MDDKVDGEQIGQVMDLDDALAQFEEIGAPPEGFLLRIVVVDDDSDISPLALSLEALAHSRDYDFRRAKLEDGKSKPYHVFDLAGLVGFKHISKELKEVDILLATIIKSSVELGISKPTQAVHFLWTKDEEADTNTDEDIF